MKLEPVDGIQYKLNIDLSFKFIKLRSFICDSAHDKFNARERERKKCQLACSFPFLLQTNEHWIKCNEKKMISLLQVDG